MHLELGATATAFDAQNIGDELMRCQRYFWMLRGANAVPFAFGQAYGAGSAFCIINFSQTMRVTPTCYISAASDFKAYVATSSLTATFTSGALTGYNAETAIADFSGTSGLVAGNATAIVAANTNAYFAAAARL